MGLFDTQDRIGDPYHVTLQKEYTRNVGKHPGGRHSQRSSLAMLVAVAGVAIGVVGAANNAPGPMIPVWAVVGGAAGFGVGWLISRFLRLLLQLPLMLGSQARRAIRRSGSSHSSRPTRAPIIQAPQPRAPGAAEWEKSRRSGVNEWENGRRRLP
jgi:hypothetical protein